MSLEAREDAQRLLAFLMEAEDPGGYWSQILRTDGTPASSSIALDQVARVILMVDACRRAFLLNPAKMGRYWPLVLKASAAWRIVSTGRSFTGMDRWGGARYAKFVHAFRCHVAALLAAAKARTTSKATASPPTVRKTAGLPSGTHRPLGLVRTCVQSDIIPLPVCGRGVPSTSRPAPMCWPWSVSACANPTIPGSWTPFRRWMPLCASIRDGGSRDAWQKERRGDERARGSRYARRTSPLRT